MKMKPLYENLKVKPGYETTPIGKPECDFIYDFLFPRRNEIISTLEIGLGFGFSAVHIMAATGKLHMIIDPEEVQQAYDNLGKTNLLDCGFIPYQGKYTLGNREHQFYLVNRESEKILPNIRMLQKFVRSLTHFSFVFIDGDHQFDHVFIDLFYVNQLVALNGFVLLHDYHMPSVRKACDFVESNWSEQLKAVELPENVRTVMRLYQKISKEDTRAWDHFVGF